MKWRPMKGHDGNLLKFYQHPAHCLKNVLVSMLEVSDSAPWPDNILLSSEVEDNTLSNIG